MLFAKIEAMKIRITIQHITLALGILVALIAIVFLANHSNALESNQTQTLPTFTFPTKLPALVEVIKVLR